MTDLQRELDIIQWLTTLIQPKTLGGKPKSVENWGISEAPAAGILIGIRALAEAERHNEEEEKLLRQILEQLRYPLVPGVTITSTGPI